MKIVVIVVILISVVGCAGATVKNLTADGRRVQIITADPDQSKCKYLGDIAGEAKASNIAEAQTFARNDLKNKAAELGGNFAKIDTNTGANAMDYTGRNQIVLNGRAFLCK